MLWAHQEKSRKVLDLSGFICGAGAGITLMAITRMDTTFYGVT